MRKERIFVSSITTTKSKNMSNQIFATEFKTNLRGDKYRDFSLEKHDGFIPVNLPANAEKIIKALKDSDNAYVYQRGGKFYAAQLNGREIQL